MSNASDGLQDARPFHLAFPIDDLAAAERFYSGLLGCRVGRRSERWIDFDFGGHQITAHLRAEGAGARDDRSAVDGDAVPVRHFGLVLGWEAFHRLAERLTVAGTEFLLEPKVRFAGQVGEQATMFFRDPAGNAIEFKAFKDEARLFAAE